MARTLLIVDDIRSNREILKNMLGGEYIVAEAAHGQEALAVMERDYKRISAVLLDLNMPVMDGFEVLRAMRGSKALSQLPVIVTTGQTDSDSEEKALQLGANDYISKPYKSAIIKQRIWNTINLRETAATINALQRDRLTGLWSREAFFERTRELVDAREPGYYMMACYNINSFKVINDQYGLPKGDAILKHIAHTFLEGFGPCGGVSCRISADHFAVLYPTAFAATQEIAEIRRRAVRVEGLESPLAFRVGRYVIDDPSLAPSAMYDRATLAAETIRDKYDVQIATYNEAMRDQLLYEQEIVMEMKTALQEREFEIWFQPQYNHSTGALIGAEALARWRHPKKGLLAPGLFVPIFEKNGFVYELDKFIWEEACRYLRKWMDEGRSPLPVSVNISRYDVFRQDMMEVITGLVERYAIPVELLRLEITESAFAESTRHIVAVVKQLIAKGFTLEIDDFGSGYSSLNTLKSVPAQVVKLDMRFLEDDDNAQRSGNIIESIVRMTKWLGMSVIAEGVERIEQADYLKSIGCNYVQGYLYARPMPYDAYEKLCGGAGKEEKLLTLETVENLDNNAFWDPKSMDTLIFNSYVGAACIYEYHRGNVELLRATDKYAQVIGSAGMTVEDALRLNWTEHLDEEGKRAVIAKLDESVRTRKEVVGEFVFLDLPGCPHETYLRSTMRVIAAAGDRYLVYCTNENMTAQRKAEQREILTAQQLQAVMDNVNCGITAVALRGDKAEYLLSNARYYQLLGYTREQYEAEIGQNAFSTIHPEDLRRVIDVIRRVMAKGKPERMEFRALRRDGTTVWLRSNVSMSRFEGVAEKVQLSTYTDVTLEKQAEQKLKDVAAQLQTLMSDMPGGYARLLAGPNRQLTPVYFNEGFYQLTGMTRSQIDELYGSDALAGVHPDDMPAVNDMIDRMFETGEAHARYRLRHVSGDYLWLMVFGRVTQSSIGETFLNMYYTDATEQVNGEAQQRELLDNLPYGAALYRYCDGKLNVVHLNRRYWQLVNRDSAEYASMSFANAIHPDDRAIVIRDLDQAIQQKRDVSFNLRVLYGKNEYRLFHIAGRIIPRENGEYAIYAAYTPITDEALLLQETQERLQLLTNSIPGGIATYEGPENAPNKLRLTYFNDGFCGLLGYGRQAYEQLAAQNPYSLIFQEDMPDLARQFHALVRKNVPLDGIFRVRVNGGEPKWINLKATKGEPRGNLFTINVMTLDVTMRQKALERLRVSEEENRLALEHSENVVCRYDVATRAMHMSPNISPIFGVAETIVDVPDSQVRDGLISPETLDAYLAFYHSIQQGARNGRAVYQRSSDLGWRWLEAQFSSIFSNDGKPVSAVISFRDRTDSFEKEAAYQRWQQSILEKVPESYSLFRCDISKKTIFDTQEGSLLPISFDDGVADFDLYAARYAAEHVLPEDAKRFNAFLKADALLALFYQGKRNAGLEYREKLPTGGWRWLRLTVDMVEHPHSAGVEGYLLFENIDEAKRKELETRERAERDPLTGVLNRITFAARVDQVLQHAQPNARHALMMLDIDGFKLVNDAFGHLAGDDALIEVADLLRAELGPDDLVGRLGGDEFVIFLANLPSDAVAANMARRICALTRKAFSVEVEISGSVGIAVAPRDGTEYRTLYRKVDAAMYFVKGSGKDSFAFYREDMADEHLNLAQEKEEGILWGKAKKRRMLIVDDNRIDHALLSSIFAQDFIVEKAKDGNMALIGLRHYGAAISVVLLDLVMPGMDGFAVLKKMQESAELRSIPVIVVSGDDNRETSLRAIRAGATDFVTKPVDPEVLRIRVHSAISKAENERLRAKNSFLEYQQSEVARYKTALERSGIVVVENDWINGNFSYDPTMSAHIAGKYDSRKLWHILLSDFVADTQTVKEMQELVHAVASDRQKKNATLLVRLKTPAKALHTFRMNVFKVNNEFGLTGKIYLTFRDQDVSWPEVEARES